MHYRTMDTQQTGGGLSPAPLASTESVLGTGSSAVRGALHGAVNPAEDIVSQLMEVISQTPVPTGVESNISGSHIPNLPGNGTGPSMSSILTDSIGKSTSLQPGISLGLSSVSTDLSHNSQPDNICLEQLLREATSASELVPTPRPSVGMGGSVSLDLLQSISSSSNVALQGQHPSSYGSVAQTSAIHTSEAVNSLTASAILPPSSSTVSWNSTAVTSVHETPSTGIQAPSLGVQAPSTGMQGVQAPSLGVQAPSTGMQGVQAPSLGVQAPSTGVQAASIAGSIPFSVTPSAPAVSLASTQQNNSVLANLSRLLAGSSGASLAPTPLDAKAKNPVNIADLLKLTPDALNDLVKSIAMAQVRASAAATVQAGLPQYPAKHSPAPAQPRPPQPSILKPQPLTITLSNGSKLNFSSVPQGAKGRPASVGRPPVSNIPKSQPLPSTRPQLPRQPALPMSSLGGLPGLSTYPGMSLKETGYPYPRPQSSAFLTATQAAPTTASIAGTTPAAVTAAGVGSTVQGKTGKDGLQSLAQAASLVLKADTGTADVDIDVCEPPPVTALPLPDFLLDHAYTPYNPEFSNPQRCRVVNPSRDLVNIPRSRVICVPVVPPQNLALEKLLKVTHKGKVHREPPPEREKKPPKKPKMAIVPKPKKKPGHILEGSSDDDDGDDGNSRRRSARNMGRRKKYVDDIDVNLSDYEEAGDSDDERQKAYKKRKYGLKELEEEIEVDSDGDRPPRASQPQPQPSHYPQPSGGGSGGGSSGGNNYSEGLVQASVYYEPPEEEAQVVEKIMGHRIRSTRPEEKVYGEKIEEYFVKYKNFSYLHVQWGMFHKLIKGDKRFDQKLKRYKQKQEQLGPFANVDDEPFNPDYTVAERVLDMATQEEPNGEMVTHLLVKWKSLPYEDSTWELKGDIDQDKLEKYLKLQQTPSRSVLELCPRPALTDFRGIIQESPVYLNDNVLRPYQLAGLNWLLFNYYKRLNCILADEMGLGKTVQSIAFLMGIQKEAGIQGPFLVIVPLTTIGNWQREFEAWSECNVVVYHGSLYSRNLIHEYELYFRNQKGRVIPGAHKFNVVVTTYEMLLAPQSELRNIQWRVCILDEAHRLKNRNCKVLEELKHINTEHRVLLTGTPLQNSVEELFSLLNFLDPSKFTSEEVFLAEYGKVTTPEEVEKLKKTLRPMMLRRMKEDVEKSLAPKEETIVEVELTGIQKQYYRAILEKNFNFLAKSGGANVPSLLNAMMELRKCCNHPFLIKGAEQKIVSEYVPTHEHSTVLDALVQSSGKTVLVDKLLPKLKANGHKVLIFSQMVKCLDILEDYLRVKGYLYERIDGQIRGTLRQAAIDRFSKPDSDRFVFLLCTRAGGLGINLTAADTVIIYDSDWNPQNDIQAQSRCHRIGQRKMVKVYRLITRNSYEREMFDRASLKLGLDRALLQSMAGQKEGASSQMGKKEIEDLLKKGAYAAVMEENDDSEKFCQEDIDQILERRTKVIQLESETSGSTFSKASFVADGSSEDLDISDPDFWQKWAEKAKLDLDYLANKDTLILDQPRQRRQTRRFGNDLAMEEEIEEAEVVDLVPARGKKGWTKLELQKVERYLLIFGWNQWRRVLHSGFKGKKIRLNERDVENMSRTILVYCLHHFKGDEKARPFIHSLIDPSEEAPGKPSLASVQSNPFAFSEDDYLALMARDPESLFQDEGYKKHLKKHANRIILRARQLHIIRWDIFGDHLEKIKQGVPAKNIHVHLTLPEDPPPMFWWTHEADKCLMIGTIKYGYEQYSLMRSDSSLCFKSIVGPEHFIGRVALRSHMEDGLSSSQHPSECGGLEVDSPTEEEEGLDSEDDDMELDLAPRKLPRMKRTPVKLPAGEGKQVWPTVADLNTRLRRLISAHLKSQRQKMLKVEKMKKQQARKEKEKEVSRQRELKRAELAQKWSRREEQDFARVVAFYGVIYDHSSKQHCWDHFRQLANLGKKANDRLDTYYIDFRDMCHRVIRGQRPRKGKSGHLLERVTVDRAAKCLERIDVLSAVREEVLPDPDFSSLITLCEASFEVPHWWIPVTHDVDLIKGVNKHGLARSEHVLYPDPEYSFVSTVPKSALFNDQDKSGENSDASDSYERVETAADDSPSNDVPHSGTQSGSGQEKESKPHSMGVPIGWPKEKAIVMRLTRIVFAFRNGYWPKPMEGLELFMPNKDKVDESDDSSEEYSDMDDTCNASGDCFDRSTDYPAEGGTTSSEYDEDEDDEDEFSQLDSDSDYSVDVEDSGAPPPRSTASSTTRKNPATATAAAKVPTAATKVPTAASSLPTPSPSSSASASKKKQSSSTPQPTVPSSAPSKVDPKSTVSFSVNKGNDLKLTIKRSMFLAAKNENKQPKSLVVSIPRVLLSFPTREEVKKMPKILRKRKNDQSSSPASSSKSKRIAP